MESKLKCPFCQQELREIYFNGVGVGYICPTPYCKKAEKFKGNAEFWKALIQTKQDFETLEQACEKIKSEYNRCRRDEFDGWNIDWGWFASAARNVIDTALKRTKHKDEK